MRRAGVIAGALALSVATVGARRASAQQAGAPQAPRAAAARSGALNTPASCPARPSHPTPTAEQRRAARELAQRAQQAAILGDRASAREQLRQAAVLDPGDADLAYQLARANDAAGAAADAASEYCRFLALSPNAPEAAEARERVVILAPPGRTESSEQLRLSSARAFSLGLVIPGAGQFYTGRPIAGTLVLGATGAAVACALSQHLETTPVQETALDPFGNPYTFTSQRESITHPCMVPGLAVAAFAAVTGAIEARNFVRRMNAEGRLALDVYPLYPDGRALALRVSVR